MADTVAIGLRGLAIAAVLLAAGVPIFVWIFGNDLDRSARRIRSMILPLAAAGLILTFAHAVIEPARLTGEMRGIFDRSLQAILLTSDFGTTMAMRTLGLLLIVAGWLKPSRSGEGFALIGAVLTLVSFAFMGHTAASPQSWLLAPLLMTHLIVVAFWFGSLWLLVTVTRYEDPAVSGAIINHFSRIAVWSVPVIFLAGLTMAGVLLPNLTSLGTPYGLSLIVKIVGFSILMALAALNKWQVGPAIATGKPNALKNFRILVQTEWLLILAIVFVTATMTALFSPQH